MPRFLSKIRRWRTQFFWFKRSKDWWLADDRGEVIVPIVMSGDIFMRLWLIGDTTPINRLKLESRVDNAMELHATAGEFKNPIDPFKVEFIQDQLMVATDLLHAIYTETEEVPVDIYKAAQKLSRQMAKAAQLEERKGLTESDEEFHQAG